MSDVENALRIELRDPEYSEGYAESFLNAYIATQIKVIREQQKMTQAELAALIGTTQAGVSRYENVNYSSWGIRSLVRMARAFHLRLKVSFEQFGTLAEEVTRFKREFLERVKREEDPGLVPQLPPRMGYARGEHGNLISIDMARVIAATESRTNLKQPPALYEMDVNQRASQEALCK